MAENYYFNHTATQIDAILDKVDGIEAGAQANVQSDWNQTDTDSKDFVKNKPTIPAAQVPSDWEASSGVAQILNKPALGTAAAKDYITSISGLSDDLVTSSAVNTALADKADKSTTYTKTEIDTALTAKADLVDGKVPASELPSYVDDTIEGYYYNGAFYEDSSHTTAITGESGKIYIDLTANKSYRWTGSVYTRIDECPAFGETYGTIYEGNKGKANADNISITKSALADLINQEAKNISGVQSLSDVNSYATVDLSGITYPGEKYEVSFGSLLSGDSSANTCLVVGLNGLGSVVTNNLRLSRGNNVHGTLTLTSSGVMTQIRIYASDSESHSTGDMLAFTNLMVCKKSFYDVTTAYKTFVPDNSLLYSCIGNRNSLTTTAKTTLVAAINELNSNKITAASYATQNTGGTVKVWTTTDGTDTILHIATQ